MKENILFIAFCAIIMVFVIIYITDTRQVACLCECEIPKQPPSRHYYEYNYDLAAHGGGAAIYFDDKHEDDYKGVKCETLDELSWGYCESSCQRSE